ncbi:MAG: phosphoribosylamine--glycine ligase [Acidobacteriota bacterium]
MRILIVGAGGREHAIARLLAKSPLVTTLFAAPGNAGIGEVATLLPIDASTPAGAMELAIHAAREGIELTVVGPEAPLMSGIADRFAERGIAVCGPGSAAAEIEGSKIFAKEFMERHGIPTARSRTFATAAEALAYLERPELGVPVVLKADGLAAGKGVVIARSLDEARGAVRAMMVERRFGRAGDRVLVEELLEGEEVSVFAATDGTRICPLGAAQDHKALEDGDRGPNTGGMGSYAPVPQLPRDTYEWILDEVIGKTIHGLREDGREFRGFLFAGLMLTPDGPKVLEFNARLGDPEAQTILGLVTSDLLPLVRGIAAGDIGGADVTFAEASAVTVVLASRGYPEAPLKDQAIEGIPEAEALPGVTVAHCGTKIANGRLVSAGGRVLGVTARGASLRDAADLAYAACDRIRFEGKILRRDIGKRGLLFASREKQG